MTEYIARSMSGAAVGNVRFLEALRLTSAADTHDVRLVLARRGDVEALDLPEPVVRHVGGCAVVSLRVTGPGPLPCAAGPVPLTLAEPDLLAKCDVLLGIRNGEQIEAVRDWLDWHARHCGADAALIVDRRRPNEAPLADVMTSQAVPGLTRVVILDPAMPLGTAAPSERHPFNAPDAPGRERIAPPPDDAWTSPLNETGLYEAVRWRFLSAAAGVLQMDCNDLLARDARPFEAARSAPSGAVALVGRRAYPWRVREGQAPRFGDHICTRFDTPHRLRRWACAPSRIAEDRLWRPVRIGPRREKPDARLPFTRAMALRVREGGDLPLVPKSSLAVDHTLLAAARKDWTHKPVLPPAAPAIRTNPRADLPGRTAIVTCMRNEGAFVLEWLAHHRAIGVDDFLIYTNDCTDGTGTLLDALQAHGIVRHRANPFREPAFAGMRPQHAALAAAGAEPVLARAGWAVCMDVDEFINVHAGTGQLRDLYRAVGDANMISMTWRLFGSADLATYDEAPTPARFGRCAPRLIRKPHQAWGLKTLFRPLGLYRKMGVHRPKGLRPERRDRIRWVNGSGQPMPDAMLRNGWRSTTASYGYDLVTLNHYAVRDAESFLVKRDRGRANHVERDQGLSYWFRMNNNAEADTSIRRRLPALEREMAALLTLPGVADCHRACIAGHRKRIAELRADPGFAALFADLTGDRLRRLSRMHGRFGADVFRVGPDFVPDDVMAQGPAGAFFTVAGERVQ